MYGKLSDDEQVLELAWKDQNVVLFMTTVDDATGTMRRARRKPAKTSTNARTSRAVFGEDEYIKDLDIPTFIDMYNHFMNGVDHGDRLRSDDITQRARLKTWWPVFYFLLDPTITNSHQIATSKAWGPFGHEA